MNYVVSFYTGTYISVNTTTIKWCLSVVHSGRYYWKSKDCRMVRTEEGVLVNFVAKGSVNWITRYFWILSNFLYNLKLRAFQINCFNIITYISCLYMLYMYIIRYQEISYPGEFVPRRIRTQNEWVRILWLIRTWVRILWIIRTLHIIFSLII